MPQEVPQKYSADIATMLTNLERPHILTVAGFVAMGMEDGDIIEAGRNVGIAPPIMDQSFAELPHALRHARRVNDHIHKTQVGKRIIHMARDGELLYDADVLEHPEDEAVLLPASIPLWESSGDQVTKNFLKQYGITHETADNHYMADTGFRGTTGYWVWRSLYSGDEPSPPTEYLKDMQERMPIGLVSSIGHLAWGEQIIDLDQDHLVTKDNFPKVFGLRGEPGYGYRSRYEHDALGYYAALSMQLMPRHHGTYSHLEPTSNGFRAVTKQEPIRTDVDTILHTDQGEGRNASIINPVASLLVQRRVVLAMQAS